VNHLLIGKGEKTFHLLAKYGNRHGLIAGATGSGKTVSLMVLAEGFSRLGVPVFMPDVKGDVAGLAMAAIYNQKIQECVAQIGIESFAS
jgi:DNA helicase HerA-like ATPase